jgi:glycosyltransferase involved in cell wall biosynthesis
VSSPPPASIAIPTRGRPAYLEVTLASVAPQAQRAGAELLVICDGPDPLSAEVADRHGARTITLERPQGLNAARNRAAREARAELIVFVDDDIEAAPGWLEALLTGASACPAHGVFGGPIRARLEGGGPRACGREGAPISALDLGGTDRDAELVWGANLAVRRSALALAGEFDERLSGRGDEEEWERRFRARGGRIRYLAGACVEHRRTPEDSTLRALSTAAYHLGRTARANDERKGQAPGLGGELRTLGGCLGHAARRRCAIGLVLAAHTAGRLRQAISESHAP